MPSEGNVRRRIGFYEIIPSGGGGERRYILPFYLVQMAITSAAVGPKLWEPVDAVRQNIINTDEGKEIHELLQYDPKADMLTCELEKPAGKVIQLHSFDAFRWPNEAR